MSPTRPTKKQKELLEFIDAFINEHGYSPSYREIMRGCAYTSVATVALHVSSLVARGHLIKRENAARSLEVVKNTSGTIEKSVSYEHEIIKEIEKRFTILEKEKNEEILNELYVLVGALKILGHTDASRAYAGRIHQLISKK